jgi:hypothetical protein
VQPLEMRHHAGGEATPPLHHRHQAPAAGPPILHPQNAMNNIEIAALSLDSNEPISSILFRQISSVYMQLFGLNVLYLLCNKEVKPRSSLLSYLF